MQISIVTVTWNSAKTVEETLQSLYAQSLFKKGDVEHIVIDGGSTDSTLEILRKYSSNITALVSERDSGIYDAMNKGIALAHGDVVGILNSDDIYENPLVLENISNVLNSNDIDLVYGDLVYFDSSNPEKIVRRYRSNSFAVNKLSYGLIPAHPTVFVRRHIYERLGLFDPTFKIAGDFEWLARVLQDASVKRSYIPEVLLRMRLGGKSTSGIKALLVKNRELTRACHQNRISANYFKISLRLVIKLPEFLFAD